MYVSNLEVINNFFDLFYTLYLGFKMIALKFSSHTISKSKF